MELLRPSRCTSLDSRIIDHLSIRCYKPNVAWSTANSATSLPRLTAGLLSGSQVSTRQLRRFLVNARPPRVDPLRVLSFLPISQAVTRLHAPLPILRSAPTSPALAPNPPRLRPRPAQISSGFSDSPSLVRRHLTGIHLPRPHPRAALEPPAQDVEGALTGCPPPDPLWHRPSSRFPADAHSISGFRQLP